MHILFRQFTLEKSCDSFKIFIVTSLISDGECAVTILHQRLGRLLWSVTGWYESHMRVSANRLILNYLPCKLLQPFVQNDAITHHESGILTVVQFKLHLQVPHTYMAQSVRVFVIFIMLCLLRNCLVTVQLFQAHSSSRIDSFMYQFVPNFICIRVRTRDNLSRLSS